MGMILNHLMSQGMSEEAAEKEIEAARQQLWKYLDDGDTESAHYVCEEFFGLEPDYVMELI